ncbi:hypothetical protein ACA910_013201 [Epithemia clementina (nom. ined.)]
MSGVVDQKNVCRPPNGHTYLTIGQDLFAIHNYVDEMYDYRLHEYMRRKNSVPSDQEDGLDDNDVPDESSLWPAAFMVYTNLQELHGLDQPVDYGSGIEYANGLLKIGGKTTGKGLQMGLWLNGSQGCQDVVDGNLNSNLQRLYNYIVHCPFEKVFLRVGYEFDNPDFGYTDNPPVYAQAFQKIVQACRSNDACREKTIFVWHSWAAGLPPNQTLHDYYPGNDYVDWIGISLFQQFYPDSQLGNRETVQEVLDFAATVTRKPTNTTTSSTEMGGSGDTHFNLCNVATDSADCDEPNSSSSIIDETGLNATNLTFSDNATASTSIDEPCNSATSTSHDDDPHRHKHHHHHGRRNHHHDRKLKKKEGKKKDQHHHHQHQQRHHGSKDDSDENDAVNVPKPIMIAESTPFRGIDHLNDPWNDWFVPVLQFIESHSDDIAMWSYINADWDSQPLWHNVGFGNSRLASNATVMKSWYQHVYSNPRFLSQQQLPIDKSSHYKKKKKQQKNNREPLLPSMCDWILDYDDNETDDDDYDLVPSSYSLSSSVPPHLQRSREGEGGGEGGTTLTSTLDHYGHGPGGYGSYYTVQRLLMHYWFVLLLFGICVGCCFFYWSARETIRNWQFDISRSLSAIAEGEGNEEEEAAEAEEKEQVAREEHQEWVPLMKSASEDEKEPEKKTTWYGTIMRQS